MTTLIEEIDISPVTLSLELERGVIKHDLKDDKSIYVTEGFPFWISIYQDAGLIGFRTHTNFRKKVSFFQKIETCNELNSRSVIGTAYTRYDRLIFDHALNIRGGVLRENFIRCARQFARNIEDGLERVDEEHAFVLAPGDTETQDE